MVHPLNALSRPVPPQPLAPISFSRWLLPCVAVLLVAGLAGLTPTGLWAQLPDELTIVGASGQTAADLVGDPLSAEQLASIRAELSRSLAQQASQRFPYLTWEADPESRRDPALVAEIFRRDHAICGTELRLRLQIRSAGATRDLDGVGAVILGNLCDPTFATSGTSLAAKATAAAGELLGQEAVRDVLTKSFLSRIAFIERLEVGDDGAIRLPVNRETISSGDKSLVKVEFKAPLPTTGSQQSGLVRLRTALPDDESIQCQVLEFLFPDFIELHHNPAGPFSDLRFAQVLQQEGLEDLHISMEVHDLLSGSVPLSGGAVTTGP